MSSLKIAQSVLRKLMVAFARLIRRSVKTKLPNPSFEVLWFANLKPFSRDLHELVLSSCSIRISFFAASLLGAGKIKSLKLDKVSLSSFLLAPIVHRVRLDVTMTVLD